MNRILSRITRHAAVLSVALISTQAWADGADEAIPSFYQESGLSRNRGYINQHANEKIDPFTGKLQWHYIDIAVPGNGGLDIKVQRSYSSLNETLADTSPVGAGWTMHFGRIIRKAAVAICDFNGDATTNPVMELPDGSRQLFYPRDATSYISPGLWIAECATAPATGLVVRSPDGTRYEMETVGPVIGTNSAKWQNTWYTKRIVDRNGNWLSFNYTYASPSSFGVQSISASDGRSLTFSYSGGMLESVSGPSGTWTYATTPIAGQVGHYFLSQVTRPDGATWLYEYNPTASGPGQGTAGGWSMKKVTYPTGGVIEYTYGFVTFNAAPFLPPSTVVTRKQVGTDFWDYVYTPATQLIPFAGGVYDFTVDPEAANAQFDKTVITGPEGGHSYFHVGVGSVSSGSIYLIGSLVGKVSRSTVQGQTFITELETHSWEPAMISTQVNVRPGNTMFLDSNTSIPRMVSKTISRAGRFFTTTFSNFDNYNNAQTIVETGTHTRTTNVTYYVNPAKWIIHQKKDETLDTTGAITRTFDSNGNLLTENRYGVETTYSYHGSGDLASRTDARSQTTSYSDYHRGIPRTENQPEGVTLTRTVSDAGNVLTETDGENHTTSYGYDGLNRVTSIAHPVGNAVSINWTANSRVLTRGGYTETVTFDGFGREIQAVHTGGSEALTVTHKYDAIGRKVFTSYPNSNKGTGHILNVIGQPVFIAHGFNPATESFEAGRSFEYFENQVRVTNERGKLTTFVYREYGDPDSSELMTINAPLTSASINLTRNGLGQITSVTQDGKTRSYGYDTRYFQISMADPEVGTTSYGRDEVGNMTTRQVGSSGQSTFSYDGRNRVIGISYPGTTPTVTKTYYRDDKLKTAGNSLALREYSYDGNKNLTQEKLTITGQAPYVVQYDHDGNDALSSMTYGSGQVITYGPDALGRPTRAAPYVDSVTHHPNGQLASMTYANGVTTTITLNSRQWPETLGVSGAQGILATTYFYDEIGNVTGIQDTIDGSYNRGLIYDDIDRVTTANGSWGSGTISYDGRGNIQHQSLGGSTLTYNYGTDNRLNSITGAKAYNFTYDVYGNVTGNGSKTFAYDDAGNMRCAQCGLPGEILYGYDAANTRVRTTKGAIVTHYMYGLGGQLLWEQGAGGHFKEYIYVGGKQVAVRQKTGS